jgi:hypothetical protein
MGTFLVQSQHHVPSSHMNHVLDAARGNDRPGATCRLRPRAEPAEALDQAPDKEAAITS